MSTPKEMKSAEEWAYSGVMVGPHIFHRGEELARAIQADVLEWVEAVMLTEPTAIDAYDTICKKHAELTKGKE